MSSARILTIVVALAACGEPYSNDDLRFVRAVPAPEQVALDLPTEGMTSDVGEVARYYLQLVEISRTVNAAIFDPLGTVNQIAALPPSFRDTDVRGWGPIQTSSTSFISLYMVRTTTAGVRVPTATTTVVPVDERFDFVMYGQRADSEEHITILAGAFAPLGEDGTGIGVLTVDLDASARLDPSADAGVGKYSGAYDNRHGQAILFGYEAPGGNASYYRLTKTADGVDFAAVQLLDLYSPSGGSSPLERSSLVARWLPDNRGRADAIYEGGDLPAPLTGRECWDTQFRRVYFAASAPELGMGEGEAARCP